MNNNPNLEININIIYKFFKTILKNLWNWLTEPIRLLLYARKSECLWIPLFLLLTTVPIFYENNNTNPNIRTVYNLLIVYFSAYISNKIPYTIIILKELRHKFSKTDENKDIQNNSDSILDNISCSQLKTLYAIVIFIYSLYKLNTSESCLSYYAVLIISVLFIYRTIFYILKSFSINQLSAVNIMNEQIDIPKDKLYNPKKGVKIIK